MTRRDPILDQPMTGITPAVVRMHYTEPEQELISALHMRQPDYNWHEDGLALSQDIWRFRGHVSIHRDEEWAPDYVVYGYVFDWAEHWLVVRGSEPLPLYRDSIYQLNPGVPHGALSALPHQPLIVYIRQMLPRDAAERTYGWFRDRALEAARELVQSPSPEEP